MIERKFVSEKIKEFQIEEFIVKSMNKVGHSHTKVQRTPLGEKIIIFTAHPGLVVGRKGENIKKLTLSLKKKFNLENPQIEISEVEVPGLNAQIMAEKIASTLERFGSGNFKGSGHKTMAEIMGNGALGVEILMSGKIPGSRAKRWRFYQGYLKKCGDIAIMDVQKAYADAHLKTGTVGIQVKIMPPGIKLPDNIQLRKEVEEIVEELPAEEKKEEESKKEEKAEKPKKTRKKKVKKDEDKGTKTNEQE